MILVDTSVWIDHLRAGDDRLVALLDAGMVLAHPFVIGELALGNLVRREIVLSALSDLPRAIVATDAEALHFIDHHALYGLGVGYVDIHLLASVRLTAGAELWTRDKRLHGLAVQLGLAMTAPQGRLSQAHATAGGIVNRPSAVADTGAIDPSQGSRLPDGNVLQRDAGLLLSHVGMRGSAWCWSAPHR